VIKQNPIENRQSGKPRKRWEDLIKDVEQVESYSDWRNVAAKNNENLFMRRDGLKGPINPKRRNV